MRVSVQWIVTQPRSQAFLASYQNLDAGKAWEQKEWAWEYKPEMSNSFSDYHHVVLPQLSIISCSTVYSLPMVPPFCSFKEIVKQTP